MNQSIEGLNRQISNDELASLEKKKVFWNKAMIAEGIALILLFAGMVNFAIYYDNSGDNAQISKLQENIGFSEMAKQEFPEAILSADNKIKAVKEEINKIKGKEEYKINQARSGYIILIFVPLMILTGISCLICSSKSTKFSKEIRELEEKFEIAEFLK